MDIAEDVKGEWQDIATAPRDGTEVLGFWSKWACYGAPWYEDGRWREGEYENIVVAPDFWMPLPPAPALNPPIPSKETTE